MAHIDSVGARAIGSRIGDLGRRPALNLRVLLSHWRLDHELARGVVPNGEPELALRAAQVVRPRHRRQLAAALKRLVAEADADKKVFTAALPVQREQVLVARDVLLAVADVLLAAESVTPRGVAMVWVLLTDVESPIYTRSARGALHLKMRVARDCLVHG